jgi:hypothetical protein
MSCLSCRSARMAELTAEMIVHFSGLENLDKAGVWVFPKLTVCLECGFSQFTISETELESIAKSALPGKRPTLQKSDGDAALGSAIAC